MKNGIKKDLANCRILVGIKGGEFTCHDDQGVVLWSVGLIAGIHTLIADQLRGLMDAGNKFSVSGDVTIKKRSNGLIVAQGFGKDAVRSDANPDFVGRPLSPAEVALNNEVEKARKLRKASEKVLYDLNNKAGKERLREAQENLQVPPGTKEVTPEVTEKPEAVESKVTEGGDA